MTETLWCDEDHSGRRECASTPASSTPPAPDEQRVKRGAARRRWSWSHPAERTARRRRDAENTSKNTHLGRLKLRICALLPFFQPSLCSLSPQWNTQTSRGSGRRWDEKQIINAQLSAPTMAPTTLVGKLARSASQERAAVQDERSAVLHRVWDQEGISPDRRPSPLGGQKQTPSLLSTWKLEAGNGSDPPCVQCACSPQLSSPSLLCRRPTTRLSSLWPTWGKLWPRDYRRRTCQCRVSMRGAQWASCARLLGLETQPRRDISQTPAKSL